LYWYIYIKEYAIPFLLYSVYKNIYSIKISNNLTSKTKKFKEKTMAKSDLLKQAIADANAVKETALANAKIALEEAFRPRIDKMLSTRMSEELEDEDEVADGDLEAGVDDMKMGAGELEAGADELGTDVGDLSIDVNNDGEFDEFDVMSKEPMEAPGTDVIAPEDEMSDDEMTDEYNEGYGDDLDLQEIIRELEEDLDATYEPAAAEEVEDVYEPEDELDDIDEIIESILREEDYGIEAEKDVKSGTTGEVEDLKTEMAEKDEELKEAYNTVNQLKSIINEVNLLNAKLLYTNKLFRNFELSEGQKMKVIENFDRAGNTREVKLVFSTLAESFKRPETKKRVVKESYASKATQTTAPKTTTILNEGFELADRWKKLAGLL
jgi:hypothetical protein